MTCVMCPRTIYMTRKNVWIDDQMFKDLIEKINPYSKEDLERFWQDIEEELNCDHNEVSENGFYFSVLSQL